MYIIDFLLADKMK